MVEKGDGVVEIGDGVGFRGGDVLVCFGVNCFIGLECVGGSRGFRVSCSWFGFMLIVI